MLKFKRFSIGLSLLILGIFLVFLGYFMLLSSSLK